MKIKTSDRDIDVRVSILPTVHGEKVVLRLLGSGKLSLNLTNLGFEEKKLTPEFKWCNSKRKNFFIWASHKYTYKNGLTFTAKGLQLHSTPQGVEQS